MVDRASEGGVWIRVEPLSVGNPWGRAASPSARRRQQRLRVDEHREEVPMSEQSNQPHESVDEDENPHATTGRDAEQPGGGRTGGETSVDEAMGAEDEPSR
jgi:hypothetical protein